MDWAHDQLGNSVHASDRQLFSYGFTCPTCGERVRRRAGLERRPHFAHYSNSAKPDCENYHPSTGEAIAIATRAWERAQRPARLEALSLAGAVVLERVEGGRFSLFLKLPRLKSDADVPGQLEVRSGLGVRKYSATQLCRPQFVTVAPRVPLVEVIGTEQLVGAMAAVEDDISSFRLSGNIFRAAGDGGQLLAPEEPLEWGETYRLYTQRPTVPPPTELSCALVAQGGTQGWYLYEIELPLYEKLEAAGRDEISRFLRRTIRQRSSRAYLVEPVPHHIDPDGQYVFPELNAPLVVRTYGTCSLTVEGSACTSETRLERAGEWTLVSGLGIGEFSILVDGQPQITGRSDECPLFCPVGVRVTVDDLSMEVFESGLRDAMRGRKALNAIIECQSTRIAQDIKLQKDEWDQRGRHFYSKPAICEPEIDAGNFGSIFWPKVPTGTTSVQEHSSENVPLDARVVWLQGLLVQAVGGKSATYLANPSLLARDLPWLYPYVQAINKSRAVQ